MAVPALLRHALAWPRRAARASAGIERRGHRGHTAAACQALRALVGPWAWRSAEAELWRVIGAPDSGPWHGSMGPFFADVREPALKASFTRGSGSGADNPAVNPARALSRALSGADGEPGHNGLAPPRWCVRLGVALSVVLLTGLAHAGAWASDSRDHERARAAVQAGEVLPWPTLLERLRRTHPGQVLELELERVDGRWLYDVKLLQANGQLLKLDVDAATAEVLQVRRKDRRKDGEKPERDPQRQVAPPAERHP